MIPSIEKSDSQTDIRNMPLMLSKDDLVKLGFNRTCIYKLFGRTDMPVVKIGKRKYMHRDLFADMLERCALEKKDIG